MRSTFFDEQTLDKIISESATVPGDLSPKLYSIDDVVRGIHQEFSSFGVDIHLSIDEFPIKTPLELINENKSVFEKKIPETCKIVETSYGKMVDFKNAIKTCYATFNKNVDKLVTDANVNLKKFAKSLTAMKWEKDEKKLKPQLDEKSTEIDKLIQEMVTVVPEIKTLSACVTVSVKGINAQNMRDFNALQKILTSKK